MTLHETFRALREKADALHLSPDEVFAITAAEQAFKRMAAGTELEVRTIIASKTQKGMVEITWGDQPPAQMSSGKARETAWMIIEAAAVADQDEIVFAFLQRELGQEPATAAQIVGALRAYRDEAQSLAGTPIGAGRKEPS